MIIRPAAKGELEKARKTGSAALTIVITIISINNIITMFIGVMIMLTIIKYHYYHYY